MTKTRALSDECLKKLRGIKDTHDLLSGKWKMAIIGSLCYNDKLRFMDLGRHVEGIAPKVLSKELKDLEANYLIKRTVKDTMPVTVEYELTPQGKHLIKLVEAMSEWGIQYWELVLSR